MDINRVLELHFESFLMNKNHLQHNLSQGNSKGRSHHWPNGKSWESSEGMIYPNTKSQELDKRGRRGKCIAAGALLKYTKRNIKSDCIMFRKNHYLYLIAEHREDRGYRTVPQKTQSNWEVSRDTD